MSRKEKNEKKLGSIPFVSELVARSKVGRAERAVSRLRVRTSRAAGRLAAECGRRAAVEASLLAAREAIRGLSPAAQEPLATRLSEAERRLEKIGPLCALPRAEGVPVAPREPGELGKTT